MTSIAQLQGRPSGRFSTAAAAYRMAMKCGQSEAFQEAWLMHFGEEIEAEAAELRLAQIVSVVELLARSANRKNEGRGAAEKYATGDKKSDSLTDH